MEAPDPAGDQPASREGGNRLPLDAELTAALDRFCRHQQVSATSVLAAALGVLGLRYGGGERVVARLALSTDGAPEERLKVELHDTLTGEDLLQALEQELTAASSPLGQAGSLAQLPPSLTIGQVPDNGHGGGLQLRYSRAADRELSLWADDGAGLTDALKRSGSHLATLLAGLMAKPTEPLAALDLLAPEEEALLSWFAGAPLNPELSEPACLHRLFEETAARHGDRPALSCLGRTLTYAALNAEANRLARMVRERGVGPGDFVALYLPRSAEAIIALLAVLKSGAAYVPLDIGYPTGRVARILADCGVRLVITRRDLGARVGSSVRLLEMDRHAALWADHPAGDLTDNETGVTPADPAYAIFTSGSTGRPKGVQISHAAACNLVRAEGVVYGVRPGDRVFQGFSLAFDASVEEVWMAFYCGAALVVATEEVIRTGPELSGFLAENLVTVFSTVPTQLSMMTDDVPLMRILILGGEECTGTLLAPWHAPGRKVFNTYGPTESTVIATFHRCAPDRKVTIGRPVPNYSVHVLDRRLRPVPIGVRGELHIGGMSLADGYINREELTRERFVEPPFSMSGGYPQRLYRSGDVARFSAAGEVEFCGRVDSQVKLRGYRVELSEIEAVLARAPGVQAAVVSVHELEQVEHLVAHVIPRDPQTFDEARVRKSLRRRLPRFMVPAFVELAEELPLLPSGKVDRRALPPPRPRTDLKQRAPGEGPRTPTEQRIHGQWQRLFAGLTFSVNDDFFDLGGHSLLAANLVSRLRSEGGMNRLSIQDIYRHPTVSCLARFVDGDCETARRRISTEEPPAAVAATPAPSTWRRLACGAAQAAALPLIYLLFSLGLLVPFVVDLLVPDLQATAWIGASMVGLVALIPATALLSVALKWSLVGRLRAGTYPLWGLTYLRLWLVWRVVDMVPLRVLRGTWLLPLYYRMMGARLGRGVHVGTDRLRAFDMVTVGDGASLGADAHLMGYRVEGGQLIVAPIQVGRGCTVGTRSVLCPGAVLEDGASLADQAMVPDGVRVPAGQAWSGSPAAPREDAEQTSEPAVEPRTNSVGPLAGVAQLLAVALVLGVPMAAMVPGIWLCYTVWVLWGPAWTLLATLPAAAAFVLVFCLLTACVKWALVGRARPGTVPVDSLAFVRKWTVDALMQLSLMVVQPLYATIYLPTWLRMMGARIGRHAEISTVDHLSTDLLEVAPGSFIADSASVGPPRVSGGHLTVDATVLGRRSFIGNSAVLPGGTRVGDGCLIGVLSLPPPGSDRDAGRGAWLGSPPMHLPRRQPSAAYRPAQTFQPTAARVLARGLVEMIKITLPTALTTSLFVVLYLMWSWLGTVVEPLGLVLLMPLLMLGAGLCGAAITVALKWLVIGRYRRQDRPLWNHLVWRSELINSLCENLAYPLLLRTLVGTPLLPLFFRLLGARLGRGVYMDTTELTEFDLVEVGDGASLNYGSTVQTHLFEDRVMKMSHLRVGDGCTVGPMSVVLYDSEMEEGAVLGGLSLLMKGETLPAGTRWSGSPARAVDG